MPDYSKSKIYKLYCEDGHYYYGSTVNELRVRLGQHKEASKSSNKKHLRLYQHINSIGWDKVSIVLVEAFSCNNRDELHRKENEYIMLERKNPLSLNSICAVLDEDNVRSYRHEYYERNRDDILERNRQYNKAHAEDLRAYKQQYNEENKEKLTEYFKTYYESHRDEKIERSRTYYASKKDEALSKMKTYYEANKERIKARVKAYKEANKDEINRLRRERNAKLKAQSQSHEQLDPVLPNQSS